MHRHDAPAPQPGAGKEIGQRGNDRKHPPGRAAPVRPGNPFGRNGAGGADPGQGRQRGERRFLGRRISRAKTSRGAEPKRGLGRFRSVGAVCRTCRSRRFERNHRAGLARLAGRSGGQLPQSGRRFGGFRRTPQLRGKTRSIRETSRDGRRRRTTRARRTSNPLELPPRTKPGRLPRRFAGNGRHPPFEQRFRRVSSKNRSVARQRKCRLRRGHRSRGYGLLRQGFQPGPRNEDFPRVCRPRRRHTRGRSSHGVPASRGCP